MWYIKSAPKVAKHRRAILCKKMKRLCCLWPELLHYHLHHQALVSPSWINLPESTPGHTSRLKHAPPLESRQPRNASNHPTSSSFPRPISHHAHHAHPVLPSHTPCSVSQATPPAVSQKCTVAAFLLSLLALPLCLGCPSCPYRTHSPKCHLHTSLILQRELSFHPDPTSLSLHPVKTLPSF